MTGVLAGVGGAASEERLAVKMAGKAVGIIAWPTVSKDVGAASMTGSVALRGPNTNPFVVGKAIDELLLEQSVSMMVALIFGCRINDVGRLVS